MYAYQFRMIVVGDSTVGKSSLLRYFCDGKFSEDSDPTVGVDFYARIIEIKPDIRVKLQIWDTGKCLQFLFRSLLQSNMLNLLKHSAGQERFRSITRSYYRNSVGALLLYDTCNYDTFEHLSDWLTEAKRQIEPNNVIFMLVGTKVDKEHLREVPTEQAQQFADYHNLLFMETSSKCGLNVDSAFKEMGLKIYELLESGKFKLQEGWDGIKSGYVNARPSRTLPLNLVSQSEQADPNTDNSGRKNCCNWHDLTCCV